MTKTMVFIVVNYIIDSPNVLHGIYTTIEQASNRCAEIDNASEEVLFLNIIKVELNKSVNIELLD